MSHVLNNDFQTWSGGTSFSSPVAGTQTADNWYAIGGTTVISKIGAGLLTNNGSAANTGVYQIISIANVTSFDFTVTSFSNAAPCPTFIVRVYDGSTTQDSATLQGASGFDPIVNTGSFTINPAATSIKVSLIRDGAPAGQQFWDFNVDFHYAKTRTDTVTPSIGLTSYETNLYHVLRTDSVSFSDNIDFITDFHTPTDEVAVTDSLSFKFNPEIFLTLTDAISSTDSLHVEFSIKGATDELVVQDWVRVRKSTPQNNWS